jgi:hypothetical protein
MQEGGASVVVDELVELADRHQAIFLAPIAPALMKMNAFPHLRWWDYLPLKRAWGHSTAWHVGPLGTRVSLRFSHDLSARASTDTSARWPTRRQRIHGAPETLASVRFMLSRLARPTPSEVALLSASCARKNRCDPRTSHLPTPPPFSLDSQQEAPHERNDTGIPSG